MSIVGVLAGACGDNIRPGTELVVVTGANLVTTEAGGSTTFTVALASRPSGEVTVELASSKTTEGTVSPATITLTPQNFNVPVTVTVTGVDDDVADGDQAYEVLAQVEGREPKTVALTNQDNDTAGVAVAPTTGLQTTESGGTAAFTVMLNTRPSAEVTVPVSVADTTEGTADVATLTFTTDNWNAPQTVTVTGVNDDLADGAQVYTVALGATTSTDPVYSGTDPADVEVTNIDNDSPGVIVTPTSGLTTSEGGAADTFTVVLASEPTADVTIAITSSDPGEGTAAPATLAFTPANWDAPQTVTVTGVDDALADGAQSYTIVLAAATSGDTGYAGLDPDDVAVTNTDNDTAGFTVVPTTGLTTTEAGGQATFTVVLNSQPTADVTIAVSSDDLSEGTVSPATLTFTAANFNAPQTVTVTGVDDAIADGNQPYAAVLAAATSADTGYNGLDPADVSLQNIDDDSAGFIVTPTAGLQTTEGGGTATFTIVLTSEPTGDVTIPLSSSDLGEGTVSPSSVTFDFLNWDAPQTITVTGVDDNVADGNQLYTIVTGAATSVDPDYSGLNPANVSVTNLDNDSAGIFVTPVSGLQTTEAGGTATFSVVLLSEPTANVTIPVTSSNTAEGTVSASTLTFTTLNWDSPQIVTVTGVDDAVADGNQPYTIQTGVAISADTGYSGLNAADVTVTNIDDDSAGIVVTPTSGLQTTEGGSSATFTVVLTSQPTANVTISLTSGDPGEGTVSPGSLTFTAANFDAPQTVTITGVDDAIADGNQVFTIATGAATSADASYAGLDAADVTVTNLDDDAAGVLVSPTSGLVTTEGGGTATFTIVLLSQPTANVTIPLVSQDTTEGTISPSSVTFTPANFDAPQTITVTGVDDAIADGNRLFTIVTQAAVSGDPSYSGFNAQNVTVTNLDDDAAGIVVTPTSGLQTTEAGGTATFTVVLLSQPTANVTIALASSDTGEGTVSPASLTFTATNFDAPQTVTITGADDALADGNQVYSIITAAAVSADPDYNGLDPSNVTVTNVDNDVAGFVVSPTSGLTTTEAGGTATFDVVLTSQPTSNVTITVASDNATEGTASTATLTFTPANFDAPQTVTVTGVDDAVADGNQPYTIVLGPATSSDPDYAGLNPPDVSVTNLDNDAAGIVVSPTAGLSVTEGGTTDVFTVVLLSQPSANVTIAVSTGDATEGSVSPATLTFTPANFATPQTVTVTGVNDAIADGNQVFTVVVGPVTSTDAAYAAIDPSDVSVTNVDNDSAGFLVDGLALEVTEFGDTDFFDISLTSQPLADVTITFTSSDTTEGTVSPVSVTFTPANFNIPQSVTVTGVDDNLVDGNQVFSILTAAATSTDPAYNGLNPPDITVTNLDNESPNIFIQKRRNLTTTEAGGSTFVKIRLTTQPAANVTCTFASSDLTEGQVSPLTMTFTPGNFSQFQNLTMLGVDDAILDGDQLYTIITSACTSADPAYNGLDPRDITVINKDNE